MNKKIKSMSPVYEGEKLNRAAFPLGGIGTGMFCIEGSGALSHLSLHHRPDVFNEPKDLFSALWIKQTANARVLEGPVPGWKKFGRKGPEYQGSANGGGGTTYGLPRFKKAVFTSRFPFADIRLSDPAVPVDVLVRAWSPFTPGDSFHSCLPIAAIEFTFTNTSKKKLDCVYSFNARNFMSRGDGKTSSVETSADGFTFCQKQLPEKPHVEGYFSAVTPAEGAKVDGRWFRGGWFDPLTMIWKDASSGFCGTKPAVDEGLPSPGGSLMVPFSLKPGGSVTVPVLFSWYVPNSDVRIGTGPWGEDSDAEKDFASKKFYKPWYSLKFDSIEAIVSHWKKEYPVLRARTQKFTDCFYDTDLPAEAVEAAAANLGILKSPTILRQSDGRLWAWEGCNDDTGCCHGSCTHVWNYSQAVCHLFPDLERTFRETEFNECQDEKGDQTFRASLPIARISVHRRPAAADGQLGGIMRVYRDWRISKDDEWLKKIWPKVKKSLDYCVSIWDPDRTGAIIEPHHNTYDIEFWGADAMCSIIYLGALKAIVRMGNHFKEDMSNYEKLGEKTKNFVETRLFNGRYFFQQVQWKGLRAKDPTEDPELLKHVYNSSEAVELCRKEGPKYQYGTGCLSDQMLGDFLSYACGLGGLVDDGKARKALEAVYGNNFKKELSLHVNTQRPTYAFGKEGGLILCSWPDGDKLSLPFPYSDEVWTGIEYQVAGNLIFRGLVDKGLEIVRTLRARYDGTERNPFDEYECGHWYARALASYGLLQALSGARYDAVEKKLYLDPRVKGDFRAFLSTATGFASVGIRKGKPFVQIAEGEIPIDEIVVGKSWPGQGSMGIKKKIRLKKSVRKK